VNVRSLELPSRSVQVLVSSSFGFATI
jgi:hypothetical protein